MVIFHSYVSLPEGNVHLHGVKTRVVSVSASAPQHPASELVSEARQTAQDGEAPGGFITVLSRSVSGSTSESTSMIINDS